MNTQQYFMVKILFEFLLVCQSTKVAKGQIPTFLLVIMTLGFNQGAFQNVSYCMVIIPVSELCKYSRTLAGCRHLVSR